MIIRLFVVAVLTTLAFSIGIVQGQRMRAYNDGAEYGRREAIMMANQLLADKQFSFWFRYDDGNYSIAYPQNGMSIKKVKGGDLSGGASTKRTASQSDTFGAQQSNRQISAPAGTNSQ